jgi:hypothetical protein
MLRVTWEIEVEAENPLEAAKEAQRMMQDPRNNWQFYVQDPSTKKISSVDFEEEDDEAVLQVKEYKPLIH